MTRHSPIDQGTRIAPAAAHAGEHPKLDLPFQGFVGAHAVKGRALSLTQAWVEGALPDALTGQTASLTLRVDFQGFTLVQFIDVQVERTGEASYALHFTDPTGDHLPALRHLLNSYIAGDVVSLGGVMGYSGPLHAKSRAQDTPPGRGFAIRNRLRQAVVAVLSVALILVAAQLVHDRVMFAYEPQPITAMTPGQTLLATAAGQLSYVDPGAQEGEVLYAILANSGDYYSIKMPCDCPLEPLGRFALGATVLPGTPLVRIASGAAGLVAEAEISAEGAARLLQGDRAELVTPSGAAVPVTPRILPDAERDGQGVAVEIAIPDHPAIAAGDAMRLRWRKSALPGPLARIGQAVAGWL